MTLAEKVSASVGGIAQRVAAMTLSGKNDPATMTQVQAIRVVYLAAFEELKSTDRTEDGNRLLNDAEQAATRWREADNRLIALLEAHKPGAAKIHQEQVVPRFSEVSSAIDGYINLRQR